jgi:hypothetical protein
MDGLGGPVDGLAGPVHGFFLFFIGLTVAGMATASVKVTIYHDL